MKVLLIGRDGQLGQELVKQLQKKKYHLIALGRKDLDITDAVKLEKVINKIRPKILINATGYVNVPLAEKFPELAFGINSIAVKHMAVFLHNINGILITFSSDYVFNGREGRAYKESDQPTPAQVYGFSKYIGELMAQNYNKRTFIIRTSGIYGGLSGTREKGNFVLNLFRDTKNRKRLEVTSEQVASSTYATDLAKATLKLISGNAPFGIYHLVNEGGVSWANFSKEIVRIKKMDIEIVPVDRKGFSGGVNRPIYSVLSNVRGKKIGIMLPHWKKSLRKYLKYLEENE